MAEEYRAAADAALARWRAVAGDPAASLADLAAAERLWESRHAVAAGFEAAARAEMAR